MLRAFIIFKLILLAVVLSITTTPTSSYAEKEGTSATLEIKYPDNTEAAKLMREADKYIREGKFKEAVEVCEKAEELVPDNPYLYMLMTRADDGARLYIDAMENYKNMIRYIGDDCGPLYLSKKEPYSPDMSDKTRLDLAREALRGINTNKCLDEMRKELGAVTIKKEHVHYQINDIPGDEEILPLKESVMDMLGEDVSSAYVTGYSTYDNDYGTLCHYLLLSGDYEEVIHLYNIVIEGCASNDNCQLDEIVISKAQVLAHIGRLQEAINTLQYLRNNEHYHCYRAEAYFWNEHYDEAISEYDQAVNDHNDDLFIAGIRSYSLISLGKADEAVKFLHGINEKAESAHDGLYLEEVYALKKRGREGDSESADSLIEAFLSSEGLCHIGELNLIITAALQGDKDNVVSQANRWLISEGIPIKLEILNAPEMQEYLDDPEFIKAVGPDPR